MQSACLPNTVFHLKTERTMNNKKNNSLSDLSIIIPNFNKGKYISCTIESILNQSLIPNEIIIIDDCSTDNSREVIEKYKNNNPDLLNVIFLKENHGVQYCKNLGIKMAKSKYICFVDSDDVYLRNDVIAKQMAIVDEESLVGTYQLLINDLGQVVSEPKSKNKKKRYSLHPEYYLFIMDDFMLWPWHYIVAKKKVVEVNMFDNPFSLFEDSEMIIKLVLHGLAIKWIDVEGKGYRVNPDDPNHLSNASQDKLMRAKKYIWDKYKKSLSLYSRTRYFFHRVFNKFTKFFR